MSKASRQPARQQRRGNPVVLCLLTIMAMLVTSSPISVPAFAEWRHEMMINSEEYKQKYGFWQTIELPEEFRSNIMHAAALPTGRILLVAGSGNNRDDFNAYYDDGLIKILKTVVYDPETNYLKSVETPSDLFCAGHALLHSGSLLIAGGTSGYELLEGSVTKPAGGMTVRNEDPDSRPRVLAKGTRFVSPAGKVYLSTQEVVLNPAVKVDRGRGDVTITPSSVKVFVEALEADASYVTTEHLQFQLEGLSGSDRHNIYGQAGPMTLDKQDFRGDNKTYEFDPATEEYIKVGDMKESRWYATLPVLDNGDVLAVSGLDNTGIITETTERYDPHAKHWEFGPNRAFPTYPALFRTSNPDVLFYSGSSAGYGPADKGRDPGFWNVVTNEFKPVSGLRETDLLETSASSFMPPTKGSNDGSQSQRVMVIGGGGIGESNKASMRTDVIDLSEANPAFRPGVNLHQPLRYPNVTVTPWDDLFVTGGTGDYRAKGNSYSLRSFSIDSTGQLVTPMADATVPRGYHSGSILLRDGRVLVFGNDPLFSDKDNTSPGKFEQRLEIFTAPQFFRGERPALYSKGEIQAGRGEQLEFAVENPNLIKTARLIPPSSTTHVTNIEQRSVAAKVSVNGNKLAVDLPADQATLPNGWYMLFAVDADGRSSRAVMVKIAR